MKRLFSLLCCYLLIGSTFFLPAKACESDDTSKNIISQTVERINDNFFYIETIYTSSIQTYSNEKTGKKVAECISSDGTTIFTLSVTGTFTYDGSTAAATSASGELATHVSGATINSRRAYTSGASACAYGSVSYIGVTLQKTVTLTCDKDGNLS